EVARSIHALRIHELGVVARAAVDLLKSRRTRRRAGCSRRSGARRSSRRRSATTTSTAGVLSIQEMKAHMRCDSRGTSAAIEVRPHLQILGGVVLAVTLAL